MENRFETILFNTIIIQDRALYYKLFNSAKNITGDNARNSPFQKLLHSGNSMHQNNVIG